MLALPPRAVAFPQPEEEAHQGKEDEEHGRGAEVNLPDRVLAPEVLKWRQPSVEVGRVAGRKQRNETRTQTSEERGGVVKVLVCDLVRDQKDAGGAHDHDKDVAHAGVVVDAERAARMWVAMERTPIAEHEPEWKHNTESADAETHREIRAHVLREPGLRLRVWTRSRPCHRPQEIGNCHFPPPECVGPDLPTSRQEPKGRRAIDNSLTR